VGRPCDVAARLHVEVRHVDDVGQPPEGDVGLVRDLCGRVLGGCVAGLSRADEQDAAGGGREQAERLPGGVVMLPASPPHYASWRAMVLPIKQGENGWRPFAVQVAVGATPDGNWGPATEKAVRRWQKDHKLHSDGVVGPVTQQTILELNGLRADQAHGLPEGLGYGFAVSEGANMLAATNWSVPGGVDCGPAQWRVYGPPYELTSLRFAFNARTALDGAVGRLRSTRDSFRRRNSKLGIHALQVAVLNHNWPAGADSIVRHYPGGGDWWRYVPNPDAPASWVQAIPVPAGRRSTRRG
jgi:peptidoglycan hydrolase-like protein with peptidoglycan-binding domain